MLMRMSDHVFDAGRGVSQNGFKECADKESRCLQLLRTSTNPVCEQSHFHSLAKYLIPQ